MFVLLNFEIFNFDLIVTSKFIELSFYYFQNFMRQIYYYMSDVISTYYFYILQKKKKTVTNLMMKINLNITI